MADAAITKDEHAILTRAAKMYERLTDERATHILDRIPTQDPNALDPAEKAKRDEEELNRQAEATRKHEEAQRANRRAQMEAAKPPQESQPVQAPEAAKQLSGKKAAAKEPAGVKTISPDAPQQGVAADRKRK